MLPKIDMQSIILKLKNKKLLLPVTLIICGVLLLILFPGNKDNDSSKPAETQDAEQYIKKLEKKLEHSISLFGGVEQCDVMITAASTENNRYLENSKTTASVDEKNEQYSKETEYLVVDDNGHDRVIIEKRNLPEICGALIVYQGKDDLQIQKNILDAVSAVLGLPSNKICVVTE